MQKINKKSFIPNHWTYVINDTREIWINYDTRFSIKHKPYHMLIVKCENNNINQCNTRSCGDFATFDECIEQANIWLENNQEGINNKLSGELQKCN